MRPSCRQMECGEGRIVYLLTDPGVVHLFRFHEIDERPRTPAAEVGTTNRDIDGIRETTTIKQS